MADHEMLVIEVTAEERERIDTLRRERGHATLRDYLLALINADQQVDELADTPDEEILSNLRAALEDVKAGRVRSAHQVLAEVRREMLYSRFSNVLKAPSPSERGGS